MVHNYFSQVFMKLGTDLGPALRMRQITSLVEEVTGRTRKQ